MLKKSIGKILGRWSGGGSTNRDPPLSETQQLLQIGGRGECKFGVRGLKLPANRDVGNKSWRRVCQVVDRLNRNDVFSQWKIYYFFPFRPVSFNLIDGCESPVVKSPAHLLHVRSLILRCTRERQLVGERRGGYFLREYLVKRKYRWSLFKTDGD